MWKKIVLGEADTMKINEIQEWIFFQQKIKLPALDNSIH